MKEIRNNTARPLKIPLPGGKFARVGPSNVAQISDAAADHPAVQQLLKDEVIELVGEGAGRESGNTAGAGRKQSQLNHKTFRRGSGDR